MRKLKTWTDEQGGIYSADKKRLLKCPDVERYRIAEGCEETEENAFDECKILDCLYVPESYSSQEAEDTFKLMPATVGYFSQWDRPYIEGV